MSVCVCVGWGDGVGGKAVIQSRDNRAGKNTQSPPARHARDSNDNSISGDKFYWLFFPKNTIECSFAEAITSFVYPFGLL